MTYAFLNRVTGVEIIESIGARITKSNQARDDEAPIPLQILSCLAEFFSTAVADRMQHSLIRILASQTTVLQDDLALHDLVTKAESA